MKDVEGRVLAGLDEFMLRTGHLVVLCEASLDADGNTRRVEAEAADKLTQPTDVTSLDEAAVARYLFRKGLCEIDEEARSSSAGNLPRRIKYPHITVHKEGSAFRLKSAEPGARIDWQDAMLADARVPSRVGAISIAGKSGSKTGLSHITDWAQLLELLDNNSRLTPMGRLLLSARRWTAEDNPYARSSASLIVGYQFFLKDGDLIAKFLPALSLLKSPITKNSARRAFIDALQAVCEALESSNASSTPLTFQVFQQLRDLERAANRSGTDIHDHSTGWHRTASRVETLVDLGLLTKLSDEETYQYTYHPTASFHATLSSLSEATEIESWVEDSLVDVVLGASNAGPPDPQELADDITEIAIELALTTTLIPIDCLLLGIACRRASRGFRHRLSDIRHAIHDLPNTLPERASLAQGRRGTRAEYLSWKLTRRRPH